LSGRHDDLADRLEQIAEELAERAIDVLREAISDRQTGRPAEERTLTQARRAVEKAAGLLRGSRGSDAE
jgi:predicted transcriptional regulator